MLKTENYKNQIIELFRSGKTVKEIREILGFRYLQPIYSILYKNDEFILREKIFYRKYTVNIDYFNDINSEEKAYIVGFIAADGHIERRGISITLAEKDLDILNKIRSAVGSNHPIRKVHRNNPYKKSGRKTLCLVILNINSIDIVKPLIDMGLGGAKTYSLDENLINYIPKNLIRHFLRGYFDGDGNVFYGKKYSSGIKYNINICGNENFLLSTFQKYFPSPNKMYFEKKSKQTFVWKISRKTLVDAFLKYLYDDCNIYLDRKFSVYENAHLKQGELLENPVEDNQQPSLSGNTLEGSTTNSRIHFMDSNADTSALQLSIFDYLIDDIV